MNTLRLDECSPDFVDWRQRQVKKFNSKFQGKGTAIYVLNRRTLNTACSVVQSVEDVDFSDLTITLYVMCKDPAFREFSHKYEGALELAKVNRDKFVSQLHRFYVQMAKYIRENNLLRQFYEFVSFFVERKAPSEGRGARFSVYCSYIDLVLQQMEYLRPEMFNVNQIVVGLETDGTPICRMDPFPNLDVPTYELEQIITPRLDRTQILALLKKIYAKYGYSGVDSLARQEELTSVSRLYINNICSMVPYIDEFTEDILPATPFRTYFRPDRWPSVKMSEPNYSELLRKRRRTLPANGLVVNIVGSKKYESILLKETYAGNAIVLLYKISTDMGEVMGRYNTKDAVFYSPLEHISNEKLPLHRLIRQVILWAYASYVCSEPELQPTAESYLQYVGDSADAGVTFSAIPGKLRRPCGDGECESRKGQENYRQEIVSINGYVRKLPAGQKASDSAKKLAEELGLCLAPDETYVQPFLRAGWVLKEPEKL